MSPKKIIPKIVYELIAVCPRDKDLWGRESDLPRCWFFFKIAGKQKIAVYYFKFHYRELQINFKEIIPGNIFNRIIEWYL